MSDKWDCPVCDFVSDGGAECMVCHTLRPADPDGGGDGNVSAPQQQQQQQESMRKRIMVRVQARLLHPATPRVHLSSLVLLSQ